MPLPSILNVKKSTLAENASSFLGISTNPFFRLAQWYRNAVYLIPRF
ncbi:hypothetical protein LEP1GSC038_2080 [Leptospira weilii str. 2006001855]|uniref:Uncharacterized protein n=1 Tax=Leptospira weilii str. 2006001855 TaxID=996804 RepID=M6FNI3_9LEPT|nr:hypothetical protein LEP1GSC038_2080 [Leptospira weilii str. 2006001855]